MKYPLGKLIVAALAAVFAATATQAATPAMGGVHSRKHVTTHSTFTPPRFSHARKVGFHHRPPGWSHGRKTGWGCTVGTANCRPPGLRR
jgi:hypothetical protein